MKTNIINAILLLIGFVNTGCIFFGTERMVSEDAMGSVYEGVSLLYDVIVGGWCYWKNHSFTSGHITADSIAKALNEGADLMEYVKQMDIDIKEMGKK